MCTGELHLIFNIKSSTKTFEFVHSRISMPKSSRLIGRSHEVSRISDD